MGGFYISLLKIYMYVIKCDQKKVAYFENE